MNFKNENFILKFFVENTPFRVSLKNISISSVVLPIDSVKVGIYGKLH